MPAKRGYPEDSDEAAQTGQDEQPYTTYQQVHEAIVSLKGTTTGGKAAMHETARRALASVGNTKVVGAVRQASVRLARHLCAYPETDTGAVVRVLVQALGTAEPSTRCEIYSALVRLHESKGVFAENGVASDVVAQLDAAVRQDLNHAQHHVRCAALAVLPLIRKNSDIVATVRAYSADAHPKVRQTALSAMLRQHALGVGLPVDAYDDCVAATKDDAEQVRMAAVELVWAISSTYPVHPVVARRGAPAVRLRDDAFVKVCDMVNDSAVAVRQRACAILGRFRQVDSALLAQTLSKQVMSHLRRGAGRSRGMRTGPVIPTPPGDADVTSEGFRLLDSGAAGAFVHGLEDDYQEVRDAAIASIGALSSASAAFAASSTDFLVDMFNDSSDRVRLCAIRALIRIGARAPVALTEEQLAIALSAMKDADRSVREGIYRLLGVSTLAKSAWLERLVGGVRANLEAYPDDQRAVYAALRNLGRTHTISVPFARALLGISDHYLAREARIDDIIYAAGVVLIMNTKAPMRRAIAEALPDYVCTHLPYLRDKYPGCLPRGIADAVPPRLAFVRKMLYRPYPDPAVAQVAFSDSRRTLAAAYDALVSALDRACGGGGDRMDDDSGIGPVLASRVREFNALCDSTADPDKAAASEAQMAVARYAQLVGHVLSAQKQQPAVQPQRTLDQASRIVRDAYGLEARTVGLDPMCTVALEAVRVFGHAVWLDTHTLAHHDRRVADAMVDEFLQRLRRVARRSTDGALEESLRLLEQAWKGGTDGLDRFGVQISAFVVHFTPLPFTPTGQYQRAAALVHRAPDGPPIECNHAFPLRLSLTASLSWVARRSAVAVTVTLPTQHTVCLAPPLTSLRPSLPLHWTLHWDHVPLPLPLGSGHSSTVRLSVVLLHPAHAPWSDSLVTGATAVPLTYTYERYNAAIADPALQHIRIDIANEGHTIGVNPVEVRPIASVHTRI
ncbi:hypothetical protein EV175_000539 [Coemansia sp. RSA 1933]|nr:hypothetical protein EV175_000539 [Coemansia sp. RSA 1933]